MFTSIEQVVESINSIYGKEAYEQAGQYAYNAAIENEEGEEALEHHLDFLQEHAAKFDYSCALNYAKSLL